MIYNLQEKLTGTRMTTSYTRIGSLARDLPEGWLGETLEVLKGIERATDEVDRLLAKNPIWVGRTSEIGII
jgi:NADH-quinone oxidoreductase subunit D